MRKIFLIFLLFPLITDAQKSMKQYFELNSLMYKYDFYDESILTLKLRKQLKIKSITTTSSYKKSEKKYSTSLFYNKMGRNTSHTTKNWSCQKEYINDTLESYVLTKSKKNIFELKSTYSIGYLSTRDIFKNGKKTSSFGLTYNENKKIVQSKLTRKKTIFEIQNNYNEFNKLIKTVYLINGKIKKQWIYECKPEGQIVASKTEELSSFCTYKEESADGSYATFTRTLRHGKPYLNKLVFSKDSILISSKTFLNDTILQWERTKIDNIETTINYKKSGKFTYKQILTYNQDGNVLCREFINKRRGPSLSKRVFELNANGTTNIETVYHRGKLQKTVNYEYSFH